MTILVFEVHLSPSCDLGVWLSLVTNEWELSNCQLWLCELPSSWPGHAECWQVTGSLAHIFHKFFVLRWPGPGGAGEQVTGRKLVITWRCLASHCIKQQRLVLAGDMRVMSPMWSLMPALRRPEQGQCGLPRGGGVLLTSDCWNNSGNIPTACCPVWPNKKYGSSSNTSTMKPSSTRVKISVLSTSDYSLFQG